MTVVITMAGLGSRFRKAGYTIPKYQIEVKGHTLFYWSLLSLTECESRDYIFIVRKEDNASAFILQECNDLGIRARIIELEHPTSGQAETAMLAAPYWDGKESLLIYNIDTYVEPGYIREKEFRGDGFIPCFAGEGDHWSFVRLNGAEEAIEVREKKRISGNCSIGAYYFATADLYQQIYEEYYLQDDAKLDAGERYVAPLYNHLITEKQGKVYISTVPAKCVHVLGTPEEVEKFMREA